jgi:cellobiose phosphorylase
MYRLLVENLLGVNLEGDRLRLTPLLPAAWPSFKIHYRYRQTTYHITVTRLPADSPDAVSLTLDGQPEAGNSFPLRDDRLEHAVEMTTR